MRLIGSLRYGVSLLGACALAVLCAMHRYPTVMSEPTGRFEDPDAMFHARRAERAVAEGTLLPPVFDRFENFPNGGRALWPPLHDATLAFLSRIGGSTREAPRRGLPLAAAFPVAELALAVLVAASLARRAAGDTGGLAAGFLLALTPAIIRRGSFGEIDHNLTEVLGVLLLVAAVGFVLRHSRNARAALFSALLWAGAILLALGFYAGLVLSVGIVIAAACAREIFGKKIFFEREERRDPKSPLKGEEGKGAGLPGLAAGMAIAAAALPFFAGLRVHPDPSDPWRLGPMYVLLLCAGAAGTAAVSLLLSPFLFLIQRKLPASHSSRHGRFAGVLAGAALFAAILVAALQPHAAWGAVARGFGFIGARDPWLSIIDEFRPLLTSPIGLLAALPSVPVFLVALALAIRGWRGIPAARRAEIAFLAVPALLFLALALGQKRLLPPAAALSAAAAGAAWIPLSPALRWLRRGTLAAGTIAAAQVFLVPYLSITFKGTPAPVVSAGEEAAEVLVALTPVPTDPPKWGVLAPWDYGHDLLTHSGRPVALDNFGSMHGGFARGTRIFLETDPVKALSELDALRLRYVLAVYPPNVLPLAAHSLGEDAGAIFPGGFDPDRMTPYRPTDAGLRTFLVRLHLGDARPIADDSWPARAAFARLRRIWVSPESGPGPDGREIPFMKLFEILPP